MKLIFELNHHGIVPLLHLVDLLELLAHLLLGLLRLLIKIQLHQILDVIGHLLDDAIEQLYVLLDAALNGVLQMDIFLRDFEVGPVALLLVYPSVDFLDDGFAFVEAPQLVVGVAKWARHRRDFEDAHLADLLPQTLVTELAVQAVLR